MNFKQAGRVGAVLVATVSLAACVTPGFSPRAPHGKAGQGGYKLGAPYQVGGIWYTPREQPHYNEVGVASWYGDDFQKKATANGEIFDKGLITAAHKTLPLPSLVEVTNLGNGRRLVVRVNDRGPFVDGRIIDLSHEAARKLGYAGDGLARVRVRYLGPAPLFGGDSRRSARLTRPPAPPPKRTESEVALTSAPPRTPAAFTVTGGPYRVQAGAYSTNASAKRAVAKLSWAGAATIEPVAWMGGRLYRVMLIGLADEAAAEMVRARAVQFGFADARIVQPF